MTYRRKTLIALAMGLIFGLGMAAAHAQGAPTECISSQVAGGTADAITIPALPCSSTTNLVILTVQAANVTTTPTLQIIGTLPQSILKGTNQPLAVGDLGGAGYRALLTQTGFTWILLNPASAGGGGGTLTLTNTHWYIGNASNLAADVAMSGDCTVLNTGAVTCLKTSGTLLANPGSATTDTTNATNISSGTLGTARLPPNIAFTNAQTQWTQQVNGATPVVLTDAAPTTWSLAGSNTFTWTLGSSHLLSNPTGAVSGGNGVIYINQAGHTATFDTNIKVVGSLPSTGESICGYFINGSHVTIVVGGLTGF